MGRKSLRIGFAASLLSAVALLLSVARADQPLQALVTAVDAPGFTVADMDRSVAFFHDVLGFETVADVELAGADYERLEGVFGLRMRVVRMRLGGDAIELTEYLAPQGRPYPTDTRANDRWFQHIAIITSDMDRAYAQLRRFKVRHASTGPQTLPLSNPKAGGIRAFYFRDPDGHYLEVLQFPPGKGDPKWQQAGGGLFLGIDHTAIVVADTDASLRLYRDTLGLRVVGESENFGSEQEHLNNVFGARLRITSLRAGRGPGIEFLEYLTPRDGRAIAADARANDLAHWQTRLLVDDGTAAVMQLRGAGVGFVSPGLVDTPGRELGFRAAALVHDSDGHPLEIVDQQGDGAALHAPHRAR